MKRINNRASFIVGTNKQAERLNISFWVYNVLLLMGQVLQTWELSTRNTTVFSNYLFYASFAFCFVSLILFTKKRQKFFSLLSIVIIAFLYFFNWMVFPANGPYIQESLFGVFTSCVPIFLIASCVTDYDDFYVKMRSFSIVYLILAWIHLLLNFRGFSVYNYMQIAYEISLPIAVIGILSLCEQRKWIFILFIISLGALLFLGCRGAFLAVLLSYVVNRFLFTNKRRVWLIIGYGLLFLFLLFYKEIIYFGGKFLSGLGFESRILSMLEAGDLFESSSREEIQRVLFSTMAIDGYPIYGLFGDRVITDSNGLDAMYAHNIVIEFLVDFGLLGGVLFGLFMFFIFSVIRRAKGVKRSVITMFVVLCLTKLMFSNSYLIDPLFFCMVGLIISCNYSNNHYTAK